MADIQLVRESMTPTISQGLDQQQVWPLKVTASVVGDSAMPAEIFVYHAAKMPNPSPEDRFECVASVVQLSDYPVAAPAAAVGNNDCIPYYRTSELYVSCLSAGEADQLWLDIQDDVTDLVQNFNAFSKLSTTETVQI